MNSFIYEYLPHAIIRFSKPIIKLSVKRARIFRIRQLRSGSAEAALDFKLIIGAFPDQDWIRDTLNPI
ncbi:hypothetical protein AJ87_48700 [Rhizobium yanglingense]|nr:hypothetical protein AJ87_48700 [Rhizobium yanglingense]